MFNNACVRCAAVFHTSTRVEFSEAAALGFWEVAGWTSPTCQVRPIHALWGSYPENRQEIHPDDTNLLDEVADEPVPVRSSIVDVEDDVRVNLLQGRKNNVQATAKDPLANVGVGGHP